MLESEGAGAPCGLLCSHEFGENLSLRPHPDAKQVPVNLAHQQLLTEELERCWVDGQRHGRAGEKERGGARPHILQAFFSAQAEGRRAERLRKGQCQSICLVLES